MNRDATVVQAAILLIIIAILGVAIIKKQQQTSDTTTSQPTVTIETTTDDTQNNTDTDQQGGNTPTTQSATGGTTATGTTTDQITPPDEQQEEELVEQPNSPYANIVRAYFKAIGREDYAAACDLMNSGNCNSNNPNILANFTTEFEKLINGYEYLNIKDYDIVAPSGKHVVCVKYTYRYQDDLNPAPISEVLSFYVDEINNQLKITDRVCEKKYKEGRGVRPCPIQASTEFCEGNVK